MNTIKLPFALYRLVLLFWWGLFLLLGQTTTAQTCTGEVLNISALTHSRNGTIGSWTVPAGGAYKVRITAKGAKGGQIGGAGAIMIGELIVASGQTIESIAGAPGADGDVAGGGGGSGARIQNGLPLIIAGGGGGGEFAASGGSGLISTGNGGGGNWFVTGGGGGGGLNGGGGGGGMGGGAGFNALGGVASTNGGGGYGGGGGGNSLHSGGGGGHTGGNAFSPSTGGQSYNPGTNQNNTAGANNAGGQVIIECLGTATYSATVTATPQPTCTSPGSLSIDLTGDFNNNTSGGLEYAIVTGNSFTGTPIFTNVTADPFNVTSGVGTMVGTYTVRVRLKYNPTVFVDKTYSITRPCNCTYYVKANATGANNGSSWADAFTSLQDALETVCSGAEIWVAAGTYYPTADASGNKTPADARTKTFVMKNGVAIYGGFNGTESQLTARDWRTNLTTLSGDIGNAGDNRDNCYHILLNTVQGTNAMLDGFVVAYGNSVDLGNDAGAGLNSISGTTTTIRNCKFIENRASYGGAINIDGASSSTISNCYFSGNTGVINSGAINIDRNSSLTITNSVFTGNTSTAWGGAIVNANSTVNLINCTFFNNVSGEGGGVRSYGTTTVLNSIFWGNSPQQIHVSSGVLTTSYSLSQGGLTGTGNISTDPLFVNAANGDLRLTPCSPAINAGDAATTSATVGLVDFAENPRFYADGRIDMGAYEYQGSLPTTITPTVGSSSPTTCGGSNGSITLSGFLNSTTYSVTYKKNNIAVSAANFTSDGSGVITLTSLGAGNYTDIVATYGTCVSSAATASLQDPAKPVLTLSAIPAICAGATSFMIPYGNETGSPNKYSISETGITAVSDGDLSNPITVMLSSPAFGSSISFKFTVKNSTTNCVSDDIMGSVTVTPVSVGGTVSSAQTICSGTPPADLSLSGQTGNVVKWQKSSDANFSNAVDIASTATTLPSATMGNLTANTYFRAVVKSGVCSEVVSSSVLITVNAVSVGGTVSSAQTICSGTSTADLSLSGQTGNVVKWQKSSDANFSNAVDIASTATTLPSATMGNLTANTYFRAVVQSGVCSEAVSSSVLITINQVSVGGTVSSAQTICSGTSPADLSLSGQTGNVVKWQKSSDANFSNAVDIASTATTLPSATIGNLTADTYFRAVVKSGVCSEAVSSSVLIQIHRKPTITLSTLQQTLTEGNNPVLCDTDANPVNSLQFTVSGLCVVGNPVWRVQVGSGTWSAWTTNPPVSQPSNNQAHRYQAACDASCASTYSGVIELTINNRATVPQNVSLLVDGVTVAVGETKEVCSLVTIPLTFNVNCAVGEVTLYSVDGGEYSSGVPTGLVDNQFHNYRVRCRKLDGTPSCVETESGVMRLKLVTIPTAPTVSLSTTSSCDATASFSGQSSCGTLRTVWYNASTNVALPNLPSVVPSQTTSYYARCQTENGCVSEKSNVVTFTLTSTQIAPVITASQDIVCTGTTVRISANCPSGSQTFWNTGVTTPSFEVAFNNVTKQTYWAKCVFSGGCQSAESIRKDIYWNAFVVTLINVGETKSSVKSANDKSLWSSQFITRDGGPELEQSTQVNPTLYYVENANKVAPRYWTINVEACGLGTDGSLTFDMLATPEMGVIRSFNTHENNAPYFMYANREGWTELYAQNHPAYGFYQDNGAGGNVYDLGLPKGLYKLGIRYWDMKGWGSIYPSTRKPQGNVLAYQEYWFRIQSKDGVGVGAARVSGLPFTVEGSRSSVEVMPNPVSSVLRLQMQGGKGQEVQTTLLDVSGREILHRTFIPETNTHQEEFGVSELSGGMYFMKVKTREQQIVLKVVIAP